MKGEELKCLSSMLATSSRQPALQSAEAKVTAHLLEYVGRPMHWAGNLLSAGVLGVVLFGVLFWVFRILGVVCVFANVISVLVASLWLV